MNHLLNASEAMSMDRVRELLEANQYEELIEQLLGYYEGLGPLPGILLPFIESFLPFLPLIVIVMANAAAYGLFRGFIFSWIGETVGSITLFLLIRRFRHLQVFRWIHTNRHVKRITGWVERRGFGPIFILLCFPFSPSSVINLVAALSRISFIQFALAILLGKTVMIFSISYVGSSLASFAENPVRTVIVAVSVSLFWLFGKHLEKILFKKDKIDPVTKGLENE